MRARRRVMLVLAVAGVAGCGRAPLPSPNAVAALGDREIAYSRFEEYLRVNAIETEMAVDSAVLSALFDQFLDEELVRVLAVDRGLVDEAADPEAAVAALAGARPEQEITADDVALYYRRHSELFERGERVRLSQILVDQRELAERALEELRAGAPFEEVARRHSQEPGAARGGDQGWLGREDLPPELVDVVFALADGEVSGLVAVDYGFHLFRVSERRPAALTPLEAAEPEIRARLARERSVRRLEALVEEARDRYNPRVYGRNLPFRYEGSYGS